MWKDKVALNQGRSADLWQIQEQGEHRLFAHLAAHSAANPRNCVHTLTIPLTVSL